MDQSRGGMPARWRSRVTEKAGRPGRPPSAASEEVGEALGLSRTTARRYLEYLVSLGEADLILDHRGKGRPLHRYRLAGPPDPRD